MIHICTNTQCFCGCRYCPSCQNGCPQCGSGAFVVSTATSKPLSEVEEEARKNFFGRFDSYICEEFTEEDLERCFQQGKDMFMNWREGFLTTYREILDEEIEKMVKGIHMRIHKRPPVDDGPK